MIVTFDPSIGTTAPDVNAKYMNFLRCVTAACTAAAGTTSLTVNPWTSTTAIDATKNCIISIDANTEAGGWTTSTGTVAHNVINSGSFTAIASAGAYNTAGSYKADFYNLSGKSQFPYNKLSFHIPVTNPYDTSNNLGPVYPAAWTATPQVNATFGCATSIDWTDTGFVPSNATKEPANTRSYTPFKDISANTGTTTSFPCIPHFTRWAQNTWKMKIAVTANYCILWTERYTDAYATGYNTTAAVFGDVNQLGAFGSMIYMGLRETQPWENSLNFNPPWVVWNWACRAETAVSGYRGFASNGVGAWMATLDNAGGVSTAGTLKYTWNNTYNTNTEWNNASAMNTNALQTPIFYSRKTDGLAASNSAWSGGDNTNIHYPPQTDPVTGIQVPGAYPIVIRSKTTAAWNPGGACRGIYKSMSGPYTMQKLYYTAANQTFTVNGETYIPVIMNEDMFLVRRA